MSAPLSASESHELKQLLASKAEIDAKIAAFTTAPPTLYQHHRSPIYKQQPQQQRRSNVPRSMSSTGPPTMVRHLSSDRIEAAQISRSISQRSAPMARTSSKGSTSQRSGKIPFTSNGTSRPMPPPLERRDNPAMTAWNSSDQPLSSYNLTHQHGTIQRSSSQRKSELQRVPEHSRVLEDPSAYISRNFGAAISPALSISPVAPSEQNYQLSNSFNYLAPSTPSTDTLTNATTLTSNTMSRTNSLFNEPLPESLQMLRFNSNASYSSVNHVDHSYDQVTPTFTSSCHVRRSSNDERSQLLVGAGGAGHNSQFSHSLPSSFASSLGETMEKSPSNESNSSASSRNKQRLQVQIQLAASRPLMPKGGTDDGLMSRKASSQSMSRLESKDGAQDKVAISKPTYQRPKHDRVYCKQCPSHPEGFRGEHELRRHQDREHKKLVKKWICVEPSGGHKHPIPMLPLSKCKACGQQKKKYGAYYNAAAHLRRAHFKPKANKGRSKAGKDSDEKRGGKAGGDWPAMSELKYWMQEVEEAAPEYTLTDSQQDEADASDEEVDTSFDEHIFSNETMAGLNDFDTAAFDTSPIYDTFQPPLDSDVFDMLIAQGQSMDFESMYNNGLSQEREFLQDFSQDSFVNDPMSAFYNNSSLHNHVPLTDSHNFTPSYTQS